MAHKQQLPNQDLPMFFDITVVAGGVRFTDIDMISTFQLIQVSARQGPLYRYAFGSVHPSFLV